MKIDVKCGNPECKREEYMQKVGFKPSQGEIGTVELWCPYCGNRVFLEIDF